MKNVTIIAQKYKKVNTKNGKRPGGHWDLAVNQGAFRGFYSMDILHLHLLGE